MQNGWMKVWAMSVVGAMLATGAYANGYKVLGVKSAKATGMGEAFITQADDPSAVAFNPAGLAQLRGEQANLQATICNAYTTHRSSAGESTSMEDRWQTVPALFVSSDLGQENMALGLGVSYPNGLSSEWEEDSFARYVATYSDLRVMELGPAFGMRLGDVLMLGGGICFYKSEARLEGMMDAGLLGGAPGMMDVRRKMEGDGTAWGGNVGLIYRINPQHGVALTYRLPYSVEYDGDFSVPALGIQTDAKATFDFPAVAVAGYAFRPTDKWKFEFDLDWTDWQSVDDITIRFDSPGMPESVMAQDLKNTFAYKLGAEYGYSKDLRLRAGYIYNENATAEETWRPSLPDTDVHFVTMGMGYDVGQFTVDTALQLIFYEPRHIDNNVDNNEWTSSSSVDGEYKTFAPALSVSGTYRF
jgi:long-chain fatty acid transport protein